MKARYIIILGMLGTLFSSCQKEEVPTYSDCTSDRFIYFARTEADSTDLSFFSYPGQTTINFPVVVKSTGYSTEDATYKIAVMSQYTTAESSDYELPATCTFRGGMVSDTCFVRFNYSSKLDDGKVRLVLELKSNEDFQLGPTTSRVAVIWVHNNIVQPDWWDSFISSYIMGTYSEKKYRLFMQVVGVDLTDADRSVIRHYALVFKQYLAKQKADGKPVREEDGTEMTIVAGGN